MITRCKKYVLRHSSIRIYKLIVHGPFRGRQPICVSVLTQIIYPSMRTLRICTAVTPTALQVLH